MSLGKLFNAAVYAVCASSLFFGCAGTPDNAKTAFVHVDANKSRGVVKNLSGVNYGPRISREDAGNNERETFYELNPESARLHDVSLQNPGLKIVDVDMIFANMHADADDPRNYYFAPTDDYIKIASAKGTKIVYRLGISIDHSLAKYRTAVPDAKKWADVCCHIIAHYNEGWANGFKMGIKDWEIWNEPEGVSRTKTRPNWAGTNEQFVDFYIETAKIIKQRFPNVNVGGPSQYYALADPNLLKRVAETKAPMDFYSFHCYPKTPDVIIKRLNQVRKFLDELGLKSTKIYLTEWHYMPYSFSAIRENGSDAALKKRKMYENINGMDAGAFMLATVIAMQDAPVDKSHYYDFESYYWGLIDDFSMKRKSYYAFLALSKIVNYKNRIEATASGDGVYAIAGKDANGATAVAVSLFKAGAQKLDVELNGASAKSAKVLICDDEKNLEPATNTTISGDKISIPIKSNSACVLILCQ